MRDALHKQGSFEAFYKASAPVGQRLRIHGVISTEHRDLDGELLRQDGMDLTELAKSGWLNDDHKRGAGNELGQVRRVFALSVRGGDGQLVKATGIEGYLLEDGDGRRIWQKARALQKAQSPRRYGFSVEGDILARDPRDPTIVTKCRVREVAITRNPVNPYTSLDVMAKSLRAVRKALRVGTTFPAAPGMVTGELMPAVPQDLQGVPVATRPVALFDFGSLLAQQRLSRGEAERLVRQRWPSATPDQIREVLLRSLNRSA